MFRKRFESSFQGADPDPPASTIHEEAAAWMRANLTPGWVTEDVEAIESAISGDYTKLTAKREASVTAVLAGVSFTESSFVGPAGPFQCRTYGPTGALAASALPLVLFMHGGGWVYGTLDRWNARVSDLVLLMNAEIISIGYSTSPEVATGVAVAECFIVWQSIPPGRTVIVAGDSSGGNLAAALAVRIAMEGGRPPDAAILIYPVIDLVRRDYESHRRFGTGWGLEIDAMRAYIRAYVRDDAERGNPLYSPINADLTQFPPCLVMTAHFDLLRDEALAFARRIVECGGSVRYRCVEGTIHGFHSKGLPVATAAMKQEIKQFLEMLAAP